MGCGGHAGGRWAGGLPSQGEVPGTRKRVRAGAERADRTPRQQQHLRSSGSRQKREGGRRSWAAGL